MNNGIIKSKEGDTLRNRQEIVDQRHAFNPQHYLIRADASDAERERAWEGGGFHDCSQRSTPAQYFTNNLEEAT